MISKADFKKEQVRILAESTEHVGFYVPIERYNSCATTRKAIGEYKLTYSYTVNIFGTQYGVHLTLSKSEYRCNRKELLRTALGMAQSRCLRYVRKRDKEGKL